MDAFSHILRIIPRALAIFLVSFFMTFSGEVYADTSPINRSIRMNSIEQLLPLLNELSARYGDEAVGVIFDIDHSLIRHGLNRNARIDLNTEYWFEYQLGLLNNPNAMDRVADNYGDLVKIAHGLHHRVPVHPVEENTVSIYNEIESRFPSFDLTSRSPILRNTTEKSLSDLGFHKPSHPIAENIVGEWFMDDPKKPISYRDGLMLGSYQDKGLLAIELLKRSPSLDKIKAIVFFDNSENNCIAFKKAFQGHSIKEAIDINYTYDSASWGQFIQNPTKANQEWVEFIQKNPDFFTTIGLARDLPSFLRMQTIIKQYNDMSPGEPIYSAATADKYAKHFQDKMGYRINSNLVVGWLAMDGKGWHNLPTLVLSAQNIKDAILAYENAHHAFFTNIHEVVDGQVLDLSESKITDILKKDGRTSAWLFNRPIETYEFPTEPFSEKFFSWSDPNADDFLLQQLLGSDQKQKEFYKILDKTISLVRKQNLSHPDHLIRNEASYRKYQAEAGIISYENFVIDCMNAGVLPEDALSFVREQYAPVSLVDKVPHYFNQVDSKKEGVEPMKQPKTSPPPQIKLSHQEIVRIAYQSISKWNESHAEFFIFSGERYADPLFTDRKINYGVLKSACANLGLSITQFFTISNIIQQYPKLVQEQYENKVGKNLFLFVVERVVKKNRRSVFHITNPNAAYFQNLIADIETAVFDELGRMGIYFDEDMKVYDIRDKVGPYYSGRNRSLTDDVRIILEKSGDKKTRITSVPEYNHKWRLAGLSSPDKIEISCRMHDSSFSLENLIAWTNFVSTNFKSYQSYDLDAFMFLIRDWNLVAPTGFQIHSQKTFQLLFGLVGSKYFENIATELGKANMPLHEFFAVEKAFETYLSKNEYNTFHDALDLSKQAWQQWKLTGGFSTFDSNVIADEILVIMDKISGNPTDIKLPKFFLAMMPGMGPNVSSHSNDISKINQNRESIRKHETKRIVAGDFGITENNVSDAEKDFIRSYVNSSIIYVGANKDQRFTYLHQACKMGFHPKIIQTLVKHGFDINFLDSSKHSALWMWIESFPEMIKKHPGRKEQFYKALHQLLIEKKIGSNSIQSKMFIEHIVSSIPSRADRKPIFEALELNETNYTNPIMNILHENEGSIDPSTLDEIMGLMNRETDVFDYYFNSAGHQYEKSVLFEILQIAESTQLDHKSELYDALAELIFKAFQINSNPGNPTLRSMELVKIAELRIGFHNDVHILNGSDHRKHEHSLTSEIYHQYISRFPELILQNEYLLDHFIYQTRQMTKTGLEESLDGIFKIKSIEDRRKILNYYSNDLANQRNTYNRTILNNAFYVGVSLDYIKKMIENGADLSIQNDHFIGHDDETRNPKEIQVNNNPIDIIVNHSNHYEDKENMRDVLRYLILERGCLPELDISYRARIFTFALKSLGFDYAEIESLALKIYDK